MSEGADDLAPALTLLREMVEIETPSGDDERLAQLATRVAAHLSDLGMRADVLPRGHLVAGTVPLESEAPHLLVLGHLDTVWPVGRLAEAPFRVDGGQATGPGVFDMKGGLVSLILALRQLARLGRPPALPLRIVLTADEEIGSPSGGALVCEHSENARAALALEPPLPSGALKIGRRGVSRVALSVHGREAHSGLDRASGVSATEELVDQLRALLDALPAGDDLSVNIGTLAGGTRANVVAGYARAELGFRFVSAAAEAQVWAALKSISPVRRGAQLTVEKLSRRPAWEPAGSLALGDQVRAVAAELGESIGWAVSPGAGDANLTGAQGVPTVDGLGPRGHGAHSADETLEIDSILHRADLLCQLFLRLGAEGPTTPPASASSRAD